MSVSKDGRIITFYSYKGGTGRSMALANIAWVLASNRKRVLVLDWDLEAPGLQRYFRPFLIDRELTDSRGVVDLITSFLLQAITPLDSEQELPADWYLPLADLDPYIISLDWKFPKGGLIDFVPAGRQGPDYGLRFAAINWQKFYDVLGGGAFIEELKKRMRSQYDYILVDSRTGVSDTSGICTIQMPDTLVVCFTFNNQSIEGASSITQGIFEQRTSQDSRSSLRSDRSKKSVTTPSEFYQSPHRFRVFPVPMRVDQAEQEKLELRKIYSRWKFDPFIERMTPPERKAYWGEVEVPYVPYFAYEEILAPFKEDASDPKTCLAAFVRIAREITQKDVTSYNSLISPEEKLAILQEFASVPAQALAGRAVGAGAGIGLAPAMSPVIESGAVPTTAASESQLEKTIRMAETTLQSLEAQEREEARILWMRMVRVPGPGENIENSKVRVPLRDVRPAASSVLEKFAAAGLVTVNMDDQTGESTVEVTNEDLLRSWSSLTKWVDDDPELMWWRQDLQSAEGQWQRMQKSSTFLMSGYRLGKAGQWYKTHREHLSDSEAAYIEASLAFDENRKRREKKIRRWAGIAALAAVLVTAISLISLYSRFNKAEMAEEIASDAQQKIDAALQGGTDSANQLQLGILLATEAERLAPTVSAVESLKKSLRLLPRRVSKDIDLGNNVLGASLTTSGTQLLSVTGRVPSSRQATEDRTAQLHDVSSGRILIRVPLLQGSRAFQLSPDGRFLAVALSQDGGYQVDVLQVASGTVVGTIKHAGEVFDMKFSPDGSYFATASGDRTAQVLDLAGTGTRSLPAVIRSTGALNAVDFSGNNQTLAVAGEDFQVLVVQLKRDKPLSTVRRISLGSTAFVIALSHSGEYLASIPFNNKIVNIWDMRSGQMVKVIENISEVTTLKFTPDSRFLITGTNGNIKAWGLGDETGDGLLNYTGDIDLLKINNDGTYCAVSGRDAIARVWRYNGSSFERYGTVIHKLNLTNLTFGSPNLVVTASADNVARVWMLGVEPTNDLQYEACSRLTRNLTLEEWNTYLSSYLGAYRRTCSEIP